MSSRVVAKQGAIFLVGALIDARGEIFSKSGHVGEALSSNRADRDGEHYHITLLSKDELSRLFEAREEKSQSKAVFVETLSSSLSDSVALGDEAWVVLGLGTASNKRGQTWFAPVLWPSASLARASLLKEAQPAADGAAKTKTQLHITVGFAPKDVFGADKGPNAVVQWAEGLPAALAQLAATDKAAARDADHLTAALDVCSRQASKGASKEATQEAAAAAAADSLARVSLLLRRSNACSGLKRWQQALGDAEGALALADEQLQGREGLAQEQQAHKLRILALAAQGVALFGQKDFKNCLGSLRRACAAHVSLAKASPSLVQNTELARAVRTIQQMLQRRLVYATTELGPRDRQFIPLLLAPSRAMELVEVKMPRNFSFIPGWAGLLAGCSVPKRGQQIEALKRLNVGLVITAMDEQQLPQQWFTPPTTSSSSSSSSSSLASSAKRNEGTDAIYNLHLPTPNYKPPTLVAMQECCARAEDCMRRGKGVVMHCGGGKGRAGTLLACFLVKHGWRPPMHLRPSSTSTSTSSLSSSSPTESGLVISALRKWRPGSVETKEQEQFIGQWTGRLWQTHTASAAAGDAAGEEEECKVPESEPPLFKFPRTHHIYDMGGTGVSRDDLLLDEGEVSLYVGKKARPVMVQEKVDGANLGISISIDMKIQFQNRSHLVNSKSHSQFSMLDQWLQRHSIQLYQVLVPGRHVLFGEWCRSKHSIHYDSLSDYFIAFDVYDRQVGKFLSRSSLEAFLRPTSIKLVPVIAKKVFTTKQELTALLDTPSRFRRDGFVEGIYLRIDEPTGGDNPGQHRYLDRRCKLVRSDFIQGITTHWMKADQVKNELAH